jgi:hypothetical protein
MPATKAKTVPKTLVSVLCSEVNAVTKIPKARIPIPDKTKFIKPSGVTSYHLFFNSFSTSTFCG